MRHGPRLQESFTPIDDPLTTPQFPLQERTHASIEVACRQAAETVFLARIEGDLEHLFMVDQSIHQIQTVLEVNVVIGGAMDDEQGILQMSGVS